MPKLTVEQLQGRQEYLYLTVRQRKAVEIFLETGSQLKAIEASYTCKTPEIARVMCYSVFNNHRVIAVLAIANGEDPDRAVFMNQVERLSRSKKVSTAKVKSLELYGKARGWLGERKSEAEAEPKPESEIESKPKRKSNQAGNSNRERPPQDPGDLYAL